MADDVPEAWHRDLTLAAALAQVPGFAPLGSSARVLRLSGGRVNRAYRVSTDAGEFVVRLSPHSDAWLSRDRSVERELHRIAAGAGLAPRIVEADDLDRWLITKFVPGPSWQQRDFADPQALARLGRALHRLHELPAPDFGRVDVPLVLFNYAARIRAAGATADEGEWLGQAARAWHLSGAPDRPAVILHHDLHAGNLIESDRGIVLLDWECAAVADPLLDIACVLSYYEAARAHAAVLLEHAGLGRVTAIQLAASVWLFDLHTLLWYRERGLRLPATDAERKAQRRLAVRVARGPEALQWPPPG